MRKNSLAPKGLSLSQAQSISNLCNQRAAQIDSKLKSVNNISRVVKIDGQNYIETVAQPLPSPFTVVTMLTEKAKLHATQAFLMENIRAKDELLDNIRKSTADFNQPIPDRMHIESLGHQKSVNEEWGWEQLSMAEINEFTEAEAYAAHIHQFINAKGKLTQLRNELPTIKTLEWFEISAGHKTPVEVKIHHDSDELLVLHEDLASTHRKYEQRVNYFKAKVKNLVTNENARLTKVHQDLLNEYNLKVSEENTRYEKVYTEWNKARTEAIAAHNTKVQEEIKVASTFKIQVDARFQDVIDTFLQDDTDN
jgi:hypothetical protein